MLECFEVLQSALTQPSFFNMLVVLSGWVLTPGRHAITESLVQTKVSGRFHHEAFHRFFSRAEWKIDQFGKIVFSVILPLVEADIPIVIDDTVARAKGPHVFGLGCHLDAARSTKRFKVLTFGHCWVVLALILPVPFSQSRWALPILFRLYRNQSSCEKSGETHRKKTDLAREMLDLFITWLPKNRRVVLTVDSAYCCQPVIRGLSERVRVLGAMASNVALRSPSPIASPSSKRGRPHTRGERFPKISDVVASTDTPWSKCTASLYGETVEIQYKTFLAHWHQVLGAHTLRVVVVLCTRGTLPFRIYFSTDPLVRVQDILEGYALRWSIEVCFRNLKQYFGFADSSARSKKAVLRTAPFVGLAYSLLVLWFAKTPSVRMSNIIPLRPWYPHKKDFSFPDILRAAQAEIRTVDFCAMLAQHRISSKTSPQIHHADSSPIPDHATVAA